MIAFRIQLVNFKKFKNVAEALRASTSTEEGRISKSLKKALKASAEVADELHVDDTKLGSLIKVCPFKLCLSTNALLRKTSIFHAFTTRQPTS